MDGNVIKRMKAVQNSILIGRQSDKKRKSRPKFKADWTAKWQKEKMPSKI